MPLTLLAADERPRRKLADTLWVGLGSGRGAVATRLPGGGVRRAELGPAGPLLMEIRPAGDRLVLQVWGESATPAGSAERALLATRAWAGFDDDPSGFDELVAPSPVLARALRMLGAPIIGALPRAAESFGRAVLGQLVQGAEANRSARQMIAALGTATEHALWTYPTREALGGAHAHELRRFGIPLRGATALHRFAVDEARHQAAAVARDWVRADALLRSLPGVGVWTSAETRLYLGDADAVSYGDYHIPAMVGWALGEREETDEAMARLLAPYAPQRGRVIMLLSRAARNGLADSKPRRGPRHALSAHRYW